MGAAWARGSGRGFTMNRMETAMTTRATIQKPPADTARLEFEPDELFDGRAPIEMMQSNPIFNFSISVYNLMNLRGENFVMSNNLPVRPYSDNLRMSLCPDVLLAYVEDQAVFWMETGYNIWQVGKPPDFVLEVASRSTYRKDVDDKPGIYASMGIPEYWMFDPTGGELYGQALLAFRLVDGQYVPMEMTRNEHGLLSAYSEALDLRLCSVDRSQREDVLRSQPNYVFYEEYYTAELVIQDVETGLYVLNPPSLIAGYIAGEAELDAAKARLAEAETQREAEVAERDARIRELEEVIRRMKG